MPRRIALASVLTAALLVTAAGCSHHPSRPSAATRSYRMGSSGIPPRPELALEIATIQRWAPRSDAAIMSDELPWDSLLAGVRADSIVMRNQLALAGFYRAIGLDLVVMIDPENGLNRGAESDALTRLGHSITEPAIQQLYRNYAVAMDTLIHPTYLGLALETNLIRAIASPSLYDAVRQMANDAAADVRAHDATVKLLVSVQVEVAWGRLVPMGTFIGIDQDFTDFTFLQALGLSSYPYLAGFAKPQDLPDDYYSRLVIGHALPVLVTEGGWSSTTVSSTVTSPAMERQYIVRQGQLLSHVDAVGWFQLTFTDLDLAVWPAAVAPFAYNGLVDTNLDPKLALSAWDSIHAVPLH
jgi:hypothetical protein